MEYYTSVEEKLDSLLSDTQTKSKNLETEYNHYKRDKEEQINRCIEQQKNITSTSDILAVVVFVFVAIVVVTSIIETGFSGGIVVLVVFGVIGLGIVNTVGKVTDIPADKKRDDIEAEICKLNSELADYTVKYNKEKIS